MYQLWARPKNASHAIDAGAKDGDAGLCDAGDTSESRFARRDADAGARADEVAAAGGLASHIGGAKLHASLRNDNPA